VRASRAEARSAIQPRALRGAWRGPVACGRGGGRYKISRCASICGGRLRGLHPRFRRAKRGAGLSSAPSRATVRR